ncbi:MAG TPA: ATP-binding protein [Stellaceae bacterium]|nr:ATP-binding protein [Stellaceae bacterium]
MRGAGDHTLSLRLRLIGLVAMVFVASLGLGGTIACLNARRSIEVEMRAALAVAQQTITAAVIGLDRVPHPAQELERLVASFRGNRHLRLQLYGKDRALALPAQDAPPLSEVPAWFVRLMAVPPGRVNLPIVVAGQDYGEISIETEPHNEILEVWNEFGDSLLILALFSGPTMLLIYVFIGRALRPLGRLARGLARVGSGDYGVRLDERLPPELLRLRDSFNRMAAQLAEMSEENRGLNEQLLRLQEQERHELARDLHDEVGPFLFAINIDAANIRREADAGRLAPIAGHAASIGEAVGHLQRQVKSMLGRLRPIGLAEFGLVEAIARLVDFWRRRHPAIEFRLWVAPEAEGGGEVLETTLYRIVQECLSNAVRHGRPNIVEIKIAHEPGATEGGRLRVTVRDDGAGMRQGAGLGYGLIGMGERVRALGGTLVVAGAAGAGLAVTAELPLAARAAA